MAKANKAHKANKEKTIDQASLAGATLGGVAGIAVGNGAGVGLGIPLGLCALSGGAACGLVLPAVGAVLGALAAKRWIDRRLSPPGHRHLHTKRIGELGCR